MPNRPNPRGNHFELQKTGIRVITKQWSQVRAIFAEFNRDPELLRKALKQGFGIEIDDADPEHGDPMLYFVISEIQIDALKRHNIPSATFLQLLGTCESIGLTEEAAIQHFRDNHQ